MKIENLNNNLKITISGILYTLDEIKADNQLLSKYKKIISKILY